MTVITHARRKSRLSKIIDEAGGVSIGAALTQAKANLEALKPRSAAEVADRIADLAAIQPPASPDQTMTALGQAYRAANGVIDGAGPFGMDDIRAVAIGLCDLIDAATPERPFDWRVLPVYAQSLQLLLALPDDAEGRLKVRESLEKMVDRKLGQPG
ncbi:chemotaxis protein CheE [Brevundimonas sp.]|uniref:chemotaxis protein CheE n=1 Tax=Brevundimonas sp. TaxID=1871086 RepID=UPI003F713EDC